MTGNIDATIRAALLLNANHLLLAAIEARRSGLPEYLPESFEQGAAAYVGLYHKYNTVDVWHDPKQAWGVDEWTQVETALMQMKEHEAKPYDRQRALTKVQFRLDFAEQEAEQEAIQW